MFDPLCLALCSGSSGGSGVTLPYLELSAIDFVNSDEASEAMWLSKATSAKLTEFAKSKLPVVLNMDFGTGTTASTIIVGWNNAGDGIYTYRYGEVTSGGTAVIELTGPHPGYDGKWMLQMYALT